MEIALVYMVAGTSSRFGGEIKQFAKVGPNNETLIEYSIQQALPADFSKIIFVVGENTAIPFMEKFGYKYKGIQIYYATQVFDKETRNKPWGTTDALCSAIDLIDGPIVLCNGDGVYDKEDYQVVVNHLRANSEDVTLGYRLRNIIPEEGKVNLAEFQVDQDSYVTGIEEHFGVEKSKLKERNLSLDSLVGVNIFGLMPETVYKLKSRLLTFKKGNQDRDSECILPTEISSLLQSNEIKMKLYPTDKKWFHVTNPEDVYTVRKQIAEVIK